MKLLALWRDIQWSFFAGIIGAFLGALIHNYFFESFTLLGLPSLSIMTFLGSLATIAATEIYRARRQKQ